MQFAVKRLMQVITGTTVGDQLALERVGRYLLETLETELMSTCPAVNPADGEDLLEIYTDSDKAGCKAARRSTSGGLARMSGCLVSSWSRVQANVACSRAEAEFYTVNTGAAEGPDVQR